MPINAQGFFEMHPDTIALSKHVVEVSLDELSLFDSQKVKGRNKVSESVSHKDDVRIQLVFKNHLLFSKVMTPFASLINLFKQLNSY